jgi:hypothetical protein
LLGAGHDADQTRAGEQRGASVDLGDHACSEDDHAKLGDVRLVSCGVHDRGPFV